MTFYLAEMHGLQLYSLYYSVPATGHQKDPQKMLSKLFVASSHLHQTRTLTVATCKLQPQAVLKENAWISEIIFFQGA